MATITTVRDVGYRVLSTNDDQSPKQILRCFIKEGKYGKFISLEKHWVQNINGDNIETKWARWSVNIPYNKEDALKLSGFIAELVEEAVTAESGTE
ncbi:MAG: hypothetical protein HXS48_13150 [Theionarchaea archaeon]|nr:MAG: hypothetical protein AYK19_06410 [Theionarchaea archaeon DG-70-1]MBU7027877.1 hypothetical protein [Theionarchaea archaeon]